MRQLTRQNIINICNEKNIPIHEKNFLMKDVHTCQEAFVTGTFAGVIPIISIDGKPINKGKRGLLTKKLYELYLDKIETLYPIK